MTPSMKNENSDDGLEHTFDAYDEVLRPPPEQTDFDGVLDRALSRRKFLGGGVALSTAAFIMGSTALTPIPARASQHLNFDPIKTSTADTVIIPDGFNWHLVASWGDPLWSDGIAFDHASRGDGSSQERAFGDNNDGMSFFTDQGRRYLVINNEYVNRSIMFGNRDSGLPETADDIRKGKAGHGVTVMEIANNNGRWSPVIDSPKSRRITADTQMDITGPARGHDLLKTAADPTGTRVLGTFNNCGNGTTPWGTYLTCEENFNGYFSSSDEDIDISPAFYCYGIGKRDRGYKWAMTDDRFDIAKHPNEPNRFGYVVEFDPMDPTSTPKKRTALGRFKHENAELVVNADGRVVVYLGDDERGEFLYKFVSAKKFAPGRNNADLLDDGTLYVAKFNDDMSGEWLALTPETTGMASQSEICIHTRQAASAVGATTMDRPEWVAAHPERAEIYCALTNNKNRGKKPNRGDDPTPAGGPNPRENNKYGQIVRWRPTAEDHTSDTFQWDLFVLAGNPTVHDDVYAGSSNINAGNMFNSPDGLRFDSQGYLWIQTDGKYSNKDDFAGMGNNQMLVGDPATGDIRRFMVGPNECEITGLTWSADKKTMFVGIQHPGERGNSHFPGGGVSVPRSSVIAITRDDGGEMG
jgi:secreted PhoX family phosphatase